VRSDNALVSKEGFVKLADFSNAVRVDVNDRYREDNVGVIYWQAPEVRRGPYDVLKVDVWSLGATIWELTEGATPFEDEEEGPGDRFPTLSDESNVTMDLLDFLSLCELEARKRPTAKRLLEVPFVKSACERGQIVHLLAQARHLEHSLLS